MLMMNTECCVGIQARQEITQQVRNTGIFGAGGVQRCWVYGRGGLVVTGCNLLRVHLQQGRSDLICQVFSTNSFAEAFRGTQS